MAFMAMRFVLDAQAVGREGFGQLVRHDVGGTHGHPSAIMSGIEDAAGPFLHATHPPPLARSWHEAVHDPIIRTI
jgi:hypothetical protein